MHCYLCNEKNHINTKSRSGRVTPTLLRSHNQLIAVFGESFFLELIPKAWPGYAERSSLTGGM